MGIKKDNQTGTYIAFFSKRHPVTRQPVSLRRKGFKTKAEARRAEKQLVIDVEDKIRKRLIPTWGKLIEDYCFVHMKKEGLQEYTARNYFMCLNKYTLPTWKDRLVDSISTDEIRELIREKASHKSASHQKNLLKFIRGAMNYAVEKNYINRNPSPKMKFKVGDSIKMCLTASQVKVFLNQAKTMNSEWYPHWVAALYTGMRNGELYALTWDKVSFENQQILVNCAWNKVDGFKSTKSGDDRILEIAPNLMIVLKELKLRSQDSCFVLPRIDKWDKGEQARELRMFLSGLGLPTIRFHDLRATWATLLLSQGVEPIKVMKMGGWKDIKTMQVYVRKAGVDIQGSMESFNLHSPERTSGSLIHLPN